MLTYLLKLKNNYKTLRIGATIIGEELEKKSIEDLDKLLDNEFSALTIERKIDGIQLYFDFQSWGQDKKTGCPGYCVNTWGLPTFLGVKPGYHFYKRPDGSVYY